MVIYGCRGIVRRAQARDLLSRAAAEHWGLSPLPELARAAGGKPYLPGLEHRQFNLSHSGQLALCALDTGAVGADIQVVKLWRPDLPLRVCAGRELDWLEGQPDPQSAFALLWCLKEARAKHSGQGLTTSIRQISIPLPRLDRPAVHDGLWFGCYQGAGWAAAVCGHSRPPAEIRWLEL